MSDSYDTFYVGVNVFVVRDNKLLLGKRKHVFGDGTWALPGGHLENKESMKAAGIRELDEETGMSATDLEFVGLVNTPRGSRGHYLQIGFLAKDATGEPELREPDRCNEWQWFKLNNLPEEIFDGHDRLIQAFLNKSYFTDSK